MEISNIEERNRRQLMEQEKAQRQNDKQSDAFLSVTPQIADPINVDGQIWIIPKFNIKK